MRDLGVWEGNDGLTDEDVPYVAIRSEQFATGVTQLIGTIPGYAWLIDPATRHWVYGNVYDAPILTVTLGDDAAVENDLTESIRDRWTAVRLIGQLDTSLLDVYAELAWDWDRTLEEQWTIDAGLGSQAAGEYRVDGMERVYRCFDYTLAANPIVSDEPVALVQIIPTQTTGIFWYQPIKIASIDWDNKKVYAAMPVVRPTPGHKVNWDNCRVPGRAKPPDGVYLFYKTAGVAKPGYRWPASGYQGTAYSAYGIEKELVIHEESNANVSLKRTKRILQTKCDVLLEGRITLSGPVPDDLWMLHKRINIAKAGGSTGYENAGAILSGLEHDFRGRKTTLHLSTDRSPWAGELQA